MVIFAFLFPDIHQENLGQLCTLDVRESGLSGFPKSRVSMTTYLGSLYSHPWCSAPGGLQWAAAAVAPRVIEFCHPRTRRMNTRSSRSCWLKRLDPTIHMDGRSKVIGPKTTTSRSSRCGCLWESMNRAIPTSSCVEMASTKVSHLRISWASCWTLRISQVSRNGRMWRLCQMATSNTAASRLPAWRPETTAGSIPLTAAPMAASLCVFAPPHTRSAQRSQGSFAPTTTTAAYSRWVRLRRASWKWLSSSFKIWKEVCPHPSWMLHCQQAPWKPIRQRWNISLPKRPRPRPSQSWKGGRFHQQMTSFFSTGMAQGLFWCAPNWMKKAVCWSSRWRPPSSLSPCAVQGVEERGACAGANMAGWSTPIVGVSENPVLPQ